MLKEIPKTNKKLNWICKKYYYQVLRTIVLRCNKRRQHWAIFPTHGPEAPFLCSVKVKRSEIFSFVLLAYTVHDPLSADYSITRVLLADSINKKQRAIHFCSMLWIRIVWIQTWLQIQNLFQIFIESQVLWRSIQKVFFN